MAKAKFNFKGKSRRDINRIIGEVRQTQLITTHGIGSVVDFLNDTAIVAGIDDWDADKNKNDFEARKIYNENLQSLTGAKYFLEPKVSGNSGWNKSRDVPAYVFPEMLYCPKCKRLVTAKEAMNANPQKPNRCCLSRQDKSPCRGTLIASRFVVVCENGHIEDFPYDWWIHGSAGCVTGRVPRFSMYNVGDRSDIDSLYIKCDVCGKSRGMSGAFASAAFGGENAYLCNGNHPHLNDKKAYKEPDCDKQLKTRLRSSTGVYFPVTINALLIPPWSEEAVKIIEREYEVLSYMSDPVPYLKSKASVTITIEQLVDAYNIVKVRKGSALPRNEVDIYHDEYKVLTKGNSSDSNGDYSAHAGEIPKGFEQHIESITIVNKLTVTEALKGFTRLTPWGADSVVDSAGNRRLSPLSTYQKEWLPAVQLRGEGIFIKFRREALKRWKKNINTRYNKMERQLISSYLNPRTDRFSPEYVFLHTFSHLLIRQLANECGYSTASMKEKIYCTFKQSSSDNVDMNGVLIYLASSDSDGSLGGLISIAQNAERLRKILEDMIYKAAWCSSDPLCRESYEQGFDSLNYSACHDCTLLPETSCEFRNVLLDRVSLVGTPEEPRLGFMGSLLYQLEEPNEEPNEEVYEEEVSDRVASITIKNSSHKLKGDYISWDDASSLFDDNVVTQMEQFDIPLADSYEVELMIDDTLVSVLLLWENQKIVIYEELHDDSKKALNNAGWTCLGVEYMTEDNLKSAFGGLLNG